MDIEEGEYVRTKEGDIGKYVEDGLVHNTIHIQDNQMVWITGVTNVVKHSKNIIDLIEVGDFVNGMEVLNIKNKTIYVEWSNEFDEYTGFVNENTIKTILTKEQYEANCYRLEENK